MRFNQINGRTPNVDLLKIGNRVQLRVYVDHPTHPRTIFVPIPKWLAIEIESYGKQCVSEFKRKLRSLIES